MKLFNGKPTWADLTRAGVKLSGISTASVQMKQIAGLTNSISQLEKMKSIKPNSDELIKAIVVLTACKSQINTVIHPPVAESTASEGPSFSRRP